MDYAYYHFKTGCLSEKWDTVAIEAFLRKHGLSKEEGTSHFILKKTVPLCYAAGCL